MRHQCCAYGASCKYHHPDVSGDWMPCGRPYSGVVPPSRISRHLDHHFNFPQGSPGGPFPSGALCQLLYHFQGRLLNVRRIEPDFYGLNDY